MIIAGLNSLAIYKSMSKNMQLAIDYLEKTDIESIEDGKYQIAGDNVYSIASIYNTRNHGKSRYEIC